MGQNRSHRATIGQETVDILEQGFYPYEERQVNLAADMEFCRANTILIKPEDYFSLEKEFANLPPMEDSGITIEVKNETTLAAASSLLEQGFENTTILNFASAKNPGGGFLGGSQAQEESLARASGLYASLLEQKEYYENNRQFGSAIYMDYMIYSPLVPVFRDDQDLLLPRPYSVGVITAPAVNAGVVRGKGKNNEIARIEPTMRRRIDALLRLAALQEQEALVLGAWGCGVFRNNPQDIARYFAEALAPEGLLRKRFKKIIFAVLDNSKGLETLKAFEKWF